VYIRYQSPDPDHRGRRIGIFGLVNTLSKRGLLTPAEETFRRETNAWYDATYTNPSDVDPSIYADNPLAAAWFKQPPWGIETSEGRTAFVVPAGELLPD
jgi:hypothetical protein